MAEHVPAYLSVDIDYWRDPEYAKAHLEALIKYAQADKIPIQTVMNHQQLLPFVNKSGARKLINIDEHSDVTCVPQNLHCGSWVSYVTWRTTGTYYWIRNSSSFSGSCNCTNSWDQGLDWAYRCTNYVKETVLAPVDYIGGVVGVGICMSPWYSSLAVVETFRELVRKYNLPYKKGRMRETQTRWIAPTRARKSV